MQIYKKKGMAGNLVKWWKHKIFGGYKQFSGKKIIYKKLFVL